MFTEFNNSKWHHFIGFMGGCLSLPHHAALFLSFQHTHAPSDTPTRNYYHGAHWCVFMENDREGGCMKGSWILLQAAIQGYRLKLLKTRTLTPLLHYLIWSLKFCQSKQHKHTTFKSILTLIMSLCTRMYFYKTALVAGRGSHHVQ